MTARTNPFHFCTSSRLSPAFPSQSSAHLEMREEAIYRSFRVYRETHPQLVSPKRLGASVLLREAEKLPVVQLSAEWDLRPDWVRQSQLLRKHEAQTLSLRSLLGRHRGLALIDKSSSSLALLVAWLEGEGVLAGLEGKGLALPELPGPHVTEVEDSWRDAGMFLSLLQLGRFPVVDSTIPRDGEALSLCSLNFRLGLEAYWREAGGKRLHKPHFTMLMNSLRRYLLSVEMDCGAFAPAAQAVGRRVAEYLDRDAKMLELAHFPAIKNKVNPVPIRSFAHIYGRAWLIGRLERLLASGALPQAELLEEAVDAVAQGATEACSELYYQIVFDVFPTLDQYFQDTIDHLHEILPDEEGQRKKIERILRDQRGEVLREVLRKRRPDLVSIAIKMLHGGGEA